MKKESWRLAREFHELDKEHNKHLFRVEAEEQLSRKRKGFLGELAFTIYLQGQNISFEKDDVVGRKDRFDFFILGLTVDVKTMDYLSVKHTDQVFVNKQQCLEHSYEDVFVFAMIKRDTVCLLGWLSMKEIKELDVREDIEHPAFIVEVDSLHSMRSFLKKVRK